MSKAKAKLEEAVSNIEEKLTKYITDTDTDGDGDQSLEVLDKGLGHFEVHFGNIKNGYFSVFDRKVRKMISADFPSGVVTLISTKGRKETLFTILFFHKKGSLDGVQIETL